MGCCIARRLFLLLTLMAGLGVSAAISPDDPSSGRDGAVRLEPGRQLVFDVPAGAPLSVELETQGWTEAEILIEAPVPGAAYTIVAPGGAEVLSGTVEHAGWIVVSFPIPDGGLYRLQVRPDSHTAIQQALRIRAELLVFASSTREKLARAEALYASAEALRNSLQGSDLRKAVPQYEEAATIWESSGDHQARVLALSGESMALLGLCLYRNAIATLDRALASLGPGSASFRSMLLSMKAEVYLGLWHNESAAGIGAQALRIARSLNDPELEARALAAVGGAEYFSHASSAAADLEEALRLATASGSIETVAVVLRYKSFSEEDQGHLAKAMALMQQAEDGFRRGGDTRRALQTLPYLADIENQAGDSYAAIMENSRLLSPVLASGDTENYATILGNTGADYRTLNRNRDAMTYEQKAVRAYESIQHEAGESNYLESLCRVELKLHLLNDALRDCQKAASLIASIHDPKRQAISLWLLGKVHQAFGQVESAVENYRRAAALSAQVPDPRFESQALIDWGDEVEGAGRRTEALPLFEKAFALSRQAEDPGAELEARYRIALWHARSGEDADAIRELKIAINQIEAQRSSVQNSDLRASVLAAVRKCHQLYVEILMRLHRNHPDQGSDIAALEISESARARSLLDALSTGGPAQYPGQAADAGAERIKLRVSVDEAYNQRLKLMLEGGHGRELDENSATLTQAIDSLERLEDADRASANTVASTSRPLTAQEIVGASKSQPATLLEYALGDRESYLWVVRDGAIQSHVIPAGQGQIQALVRKWRSLAAAGPPREGEDTGLARASAELSCKLVAPFLEPGMGKLAIVADGDLALLAFASLPANGCDPDPGPPLITAHQVVMIPSLSVFLMQQKPVASLAFPKEVAILADPVFDSGDERVQVESSDLHSAHDAAAAKMKMQGPALPRLAGTAQEAAGIADIVGADKVSLFLGFNASLDTILSPAMRDYRILHLATHGVLDMATPGLSGLVLSMVSPEGHPVGGFLKIDDIASLRLPAELVVLSSCDSGAGDNLGGEGVTGLPHAFLEAGARRVVSSLWSVDDTTTRQLMVDFYREMFLNGADPAEALRRSQLKMMARPRRSAPYYWAGFEITSAGH